MKLKKIVWGAMALTLFISCGNKQEAAQAEVAPYPTVVLEEQNTELLSIYPVSIKGQEDIEIRPRIDGFIDAIYIDEGSVVKKGQALFKINSPQAEQALTTAEASVKSAQARVNTAKTNVSRIKPLAERGIVGNVQLETAEDSYESAIADLEQAQAMLKNAKATISWTNVTAPVDGFVGAIPFRQGSLVNSSNILTTVANTGNVFAYFSLNEKELRAFMNDLEGSTQAEKIKNIPEVTLTLADGTVYPEKGKIGTITGVLNITTGSATFRGEFPNQHGELKSGTSGTISIPRKLEKVFVIPQKATFPQQDKILVYAVQGDSVMQRVITAVSTPDGKSYAVTDGLKAGDRIVMDGIATLSNGKKIQVQ
ncbi:efflux RND transporter periplasmic adaptor subunit [Prevotella sp. 10(H)]|uniref:efflux RND transporter periplasmic adaptor subunit n=1 Tax=Prevotella sp. 10(H) TaxID=1158294 RepID=UPI0004A7177F|nr:efflux RND transporter periplasmic adaptor subunit [Prevotella sp. 10(H)]